MEIRSNKMVRGRGQFLKISSNGKRLLFFLLCKKKKAIYFCKTKLKILASPSFYIVYILFYEILKTLSEDFISQS